MRSVPSASGPAAVDVDIGAAGRSAVIRAQLEPHHRETARGRRDEYLAEEDLAEVLDDNGMVIDLSGRIRRSVPVDRPDDGRVDRFASRNEPARRGRRPPLEMGGHEQV